MADKEHRQQTFAIKVTFQVKNCADEIVLRNLVRNRINLGRDFSHVLEEDYGMDNTVSEIEVVTVG